MSYIVLARKYRPQKFDDIVGQEHIARVLKNAIKENRVAHGYIFAGQRGVGKTTTARIFAKALNCKNGSKDEPCNECDSCREIVNGTSIDVMEIDAASNRGIDQIRELRENIKYAPSSSKYKIYIIDEAHQITTDAFNALLKTLEEPPPHAIFMFATTSAQKIPPTILSRCQRFSFRPLSIKEISEQIEKIADVEKIKIDKQSVAMVSRSAGGALRDALSVFDQVLSFCGTNITVNDVMSILGTVKEDILSDLFDCIAKNDTKNLLMLVNKTILLGYDPLNIVSDLQDYIRNIILYKISPELVLTVSDTEKLKKYSQSLSIDVLLRLVQILSDCIDRMKNVEQPSLILEVFCIKLAQKYVGLDELIGRLENLESSNVSLPGTEISVQPVIEEPQTINVSVEKVRSIWNDISKSEKIRPRILACFSGTEISSQNDDTFLLEFSDSYKMETVLSNKDVWLPLMEQKLGAKFNFTARVVVDTPKEPPHPKNPPVSKNKECEHSTVKQSTTVVKNIIDLFGGEVVND